MPSPESADARRTLLVVSVAAAMTTMDITIVNVALGAIGVDLDASFGQLQWVVNAYPLLFAALLLAGGSLADRIGHRRVFVTGVLLFTCGSLLCGAAPEAVSLIAGRCVQGVGGALIMAAAVPLLVLAHPGERRTAAIGVLSATAGVSAAVAPVIGGALVSGLGWRWVFLVNLVPGVLVVLGARRWLAADDPAGRRRLDLPGTALGVLTLGATNLVVVSGTENGWASARTVGVGLVALAGLAAFLVVEVRTADPMLDLALFRVPAFAGAGALSFLTRAVGFGVMPYLVLWLQGVRGQSALDAGLQVVALPAAIVVGSLTVARVQRRLGARGTVVAGFAAMAVGYLPLTRIDESATWLTALPGLVLIGAGMGLLFAPLMNLSVTVVPPRHAGMASGTANSFFPLGTAVGVAVFGAVLAARIADLFPGSGPARDLVEAGRPGEVPAPDDVLGRIAFTGALSTVAWVAAAAAVVGVVVALTTVPSRRAAAVAPPARVDADRA
ncbi:MULTISPECIES: MFS transporter [unclassified Micromonospora]|uniref:MFS transporter n=1 Tax=unclassified Micromonospora TaxID=2617518 RepID=UPI001C248A83|nr:MULTISPECIES: MFS transporter [unclassified Micromonospora]MBU8861568.1 MFS transporter [Micromonospora sp. WMMB482]MDM4781136.1 MFS transporter [Micromonospora sp. b486]